MIFYKRLFASYYFLLLKLRKINRARIEDTQAVILVLVTQILIALVIVLILKKADIIKIASISKVLLIGVSLIIMFCAERYFLSNRIRRNEIIDSYRDLPIFQKRIWTVISLSVNIIPIVLIIIIGVNTT